MTVFLIIVGVLLILFYIFPIIQVCGDSMYPNFKDGEIIIGCRIFSMKEKGVYIYHPPVGENKYVIKRLINAHPKNSNRLFFRGDNYDHSFDSRHYGYVCRKEVVAKYIFKVYRKECS